MKTNQISYSFLLQNLPNTPLGGYVIQQKMEHDARKDAMRTRPTVPDNHKKAAVMALLFPDKDDWQLTLIQRNEYDGAHSGQLAFPGGSFDAEDVTVQTTALRETFEEVGVAHDRITIVRAMTELYIPISNFLVYPFIGICAEKPDFKAQPEEVVAILHVPIAHFFDATNKKIKDLEVGHFTLKNVPYYDINGRILWGATAMMVAELEYMLSKFVGD